ncbi:hypothetical protein PPUN109347_41440 [Pseudomonas putida]|nr:hypothetical protein PPUN109347_41440 [Pseudomonas putida]
MSYVQFYEIGRAREMANALHGTGYAGVRGHARSHKERAR